MDLFTWLQYGYVSFCSKPLSKSAIPCWAFCVNPYCKHYLNVQFHAYHFSVHKACTMLCLRYGLLAWLCADREVRHTRSKIQEDALLAVFHATHITARSLWWQQCPRGSLFWGGTHPGTYLWWTRWIVQVHSNTVKIVLPTLSSSHLSMLWWSCAWLSSKGDLVY